MKKRLFILCTALILILSLFIFLYFTVTFEITLQTTGNGTLQAEKLRVHPFESVRIRAVPDYENGANVILQSISVNGKDMTDKVRFGTLRLRFIWGNQTVCAEFQTTAEPVRANAAVFVCSRPANRSARFLLDNPFAVCYSKVDRKTLC